ncbi:3'-5' ssDNA/RNA exonuclease TatD [Pectobacterium sp. B1J-3]|uniref:3'-5' ssDNA/RNA exonuclease TatD n=1 Tax=Pectobacterium sp. B1J-3 TaxID=3385371 RepID=UPI003905D356
MFDIGVNLTNSQFTKDRELVVARAQQAGVSGMLITGTNIEESKQALALAEQYPAYCWSTAGVHPHDASHWNDSTVEQVYHLAQSDRVVSIGECGLDFNRNFSTPAEQELAFSAQLALAAELSLPVFLHCREAHVRFLALLKPWLDKLPSAVIHCFTGNRTELDECIAQGLMVGITGWVCDERRGLELRSLLKHIPVDRLLLETDAPYLLPRDLSPKPVFRRNEPCFLPHIVHQIAGWREDDAAWLGQKTDENARRVFRLA